MRRYVAALCAVAAAGLLPVCHHDKRFIDACGEPVYGGSASDEAWYTIVDAEARVQLGHASAAQIIAPTEGQAIPASGSAPRVTWTSALASRLLAPGDVRLAEVPRRSFGEVLARLLMSRAEAHLPPVTGDVHYLQISIPGRTCEYRVFTTELDWQVDAAAWAAMKAAGGQAITIQVTSAYLVENRLREGPYRPSQRRTFRVTP